MIKYLLSRCMRGFMLLAVAAAILIMLTACLRETKPDPDSEDPEDLPGIAQTQKDDPSKESESPAPVPEPEPEPEPPPTAPVNPLTGLPVEESTVNNRPYAIMINNVRPAQPLLGVSKADILYEIPVEGGYTRMMALFHDVSDVGVIGSVRSSRHYYVDIAEGYDAVYIFAGGSPQAYTALSSRNITRLDGVNGSRTEIFYRDSERRKTMSSEHTMVTTGELISKWLPTYDYRLEHEDGFSSPFDFTEDGTPGGGLPANEFTLKFSGAKSTSFAYNGEGLYELSQFGSSCKDGNDGEVLTFTNILILETSVSLIRGDTAGRLDIITTGSGSGYFICGGKCIGVDWSRAANSDQFSYKLKDGSPLSFGVGKTYIGVLPTNTEIVFS